jgi:hypothetical protein
MKPRSSDFLFAHPIAGPEALLANGFRMPPGMVVSHAYLVADAPKGAEWFVDAFPPARDEAYVRDRCDRFLETVQRTGRVFVASTETGLAAIPAHVGDGAITLLFSCEAFARSFCDEGGFDGLHAEELSVKELLEDLLPWKIEEEGLIGPDWTPDLVGAEVDPSLLRAWLSAPGGTGAASGVE